MIEMLLSDYDRAFGIKSVALRYFNAAGADPSGMLGEDHEPETHLIPNILRSLRGDRAQTLKVFGKEYPTPDGTCVRDYIHVLDLCNAHLLALRHLAETGRSEVLNLGNGQGFSVLDVIECAQRVTGHTVSYTVDAPRPGDPPVLVASAAKAKEILSWSPQYTALESIIETAWAWHRKPS